MAYQNENIKTSETVLENKVLSLPIKIKRK